MMYKTAVCYDLGDLLTLNLADRNKVSILSHYYRADTNTSFSIDTIDTWIDPSTSTGAERNHANQTR